MSSRDERAPVKYRDAPISLARATAFDDSTEAEIGALIQPVSPSGCWEWLGSKSNGYGVKKTRAGQVTVHRWVWETFRGPLEPGVHLHHQCENKGCVNPAHMIPMSAGDHIAYHAALRRKRRAS